MSPAPFAFALDGPFFRVAPPARVHDTRSVLAFSMAKAGSTLLYDLLSTACYKADLTYFSIDDYLFRHNVASDHRPISIGSVFSEQGFCYGGFRQFPAYPIPILHSCKSVLLVRDPRDMLISLYFSLRTSHGIPEPSGKSAVADQMIAARQHALNANMSEWIRSNISSYVRMFEGYVAQGFLWRPNVRLYRYEDVIYEKADWLRDMADWFGWTLPDEWIAEVAARFDVIPDVPDPTEHIRQVHPGGHAEHFTAADVALIENGLREYMTFFGYL